MNDDEADELAITLCGECSAKLTGGENWLGAMKLDGSFECIICHSLCCAHLQEPGEIKICLGCV